MRSHPDRAGLLGSRATPAPGRVERPATKAHAAIDGTGWVQEAVDRQPLTEVGQIFRMAMHHSGHPDGDYRTVNKVAALDAPRTIAWLTGQELNDGENEFGGWVWRYDLKPLTPSDTAVTLTYDWSEVPQYVQDRGIPFPPPAPTTCTTR